MKVKKKKICTIAISELRVCLSALHFAHNCLLIAAEQDCPKAVATHGNKLILQKFILGVVNNSFLFHNWQQLYHHALFR